MGFFEICYQHTLISFELNYLNALARARNTFSLIFCLVGQPYASMPWREHLATFLISVLILPGAEIDAQDCFGRSPLHDACELNYDDMVEFLLQNGANINIQTYNQKQRPIHFAAKNDACQCLTKLLASGADINSLDGKNRTPLQVCWLIW